MDLEYVASGCGYLRMVSSDFLNDPQAIKNLNDMFIELSSKNDNSMSLLFNAHTERTFGKRFERNHKDATRAFYSDSGGLQILTQGLDINEKMKNKVYNIQGAFSDYGMCFDEIPVQFDGNTTSRNASEGRWFDKENFESKARETGRNLNNQINAFKDIGSNCKPLFITQGNCLDTYVRWTELALEELDTGNEKYIGGVAMGAAALGPGPLEDIKRAFYYTQLPGLDHLNHLHLLGVGSAKRLIPALSMLLYGHYTPDIRISYDSTTHTSCPHLGNYYIDNRLTSYGRDISNPFYERMYNDIKRVCGDKFYLDLETFKVAINHGSKSYTELGRDPKDVVNAFQMHIMGCISNFTDQVYKIAQSEDEMMKLLRPRERKPIQALKTVRDKKDFENWESRYGKYITSKAFPDEKINTLF